MDLHCDSCSHVAASRAALRHHVASSHVDDCVFNIEGHTISVKRVAGVFNCVCGSSSKSSMWFARHKRCYVRELQRETPPGPIAVGNEAATSDTRETPPGPIAVGNEAATSDTRETPPQQIAVGNEADTDLTFLRRYNLTYRQEYNLLVCLECKCALGIAFASHTRKRHRVPIPQKIEQRIKVLCFSDESLYFKPCQPLIPPLDFLPTTEGFKCYTCNHYGVSQKHVVEHSKTAHGNDKTVPCRVQTLSTSSCVRYFGVLPDTTACQSSTVSAEVTQIVKTTMSHVLKGCSLSPEPIKHRNVFYVVTGWYPEPESVDKYHHVDIKGMLSVPVLANDEHYENFQCIRKLFEDSIRQVNMHEYCFRLSVNAGEDRDKPLWSPQCETTVKDYALVFASLVFFVQNLTMKGPRELKPSQLVTDASRELFQSPSKETIFALLRLLLEGSITDNESTAFIPLFVRFRCFNDRSLLSPDGVSRLCSKLLYLMKLSVLELVAADQCKVEAMGVLLPYVKVEPGNFNVFSYVCRLKALATKVDRSSNRLPLIAQSTRSPLDIIVRGVGLRADQLREVYRRALDVCKTLSQELLLGANILISKPHDNLEGSRILADRDANKSETVCCGLLTHILRTDSLRSKMVNSITDGMVQYRHSEASEYMKMYTRYLENMLVVIHIGSGMPARATELETYRLINGRSSKRSVFYLEGQVFLHSEYSKSRSIRGANRPISRFLDEEASCIMLQDILVVRPFLCTIASFLGENDDDVYNTDLFVRHGRRMQAEDIRSTFARLFYDYCGSAISFADYRHVCKYFANLLQMPYRLPDDNESDDESAATPILTVDEQFGHSSNTSNRYYGRHSGELGNTREHILYSFRTLSCQWHTFIREGRHHSDKDKNRTVSSLPESVPRPRHTAVREVRENASTFVCHKTQLVTVKQSSESLMQLRRLYKDERAVFKSAELRAAVDNVLHTREDVLAILPTGAGKSLLFMLYATMNVTLTAVVVVPTISLKHDLQRRARSFGILCTDNPAIVTDEQLVFVTPEAAAEGAVRDHIMQLYCRKRLGAIFVDEAHLFSMHSQFRPSFRQLPQLRCMPVPLVLVTATAPQWIVQDLLLNFFGPGRTPTVVRQSTNRLNLSYSVSLNASLERVADQIKFQVDRYTQEDRGIVYVPAIDLIMVVKGELCTRGIPCSVYSGQYDEEDNVANFAAWREGNAVVMVATSAFGLGIDYPSVRNVHLFGLPFSLEEYCQQCGRAGRDGKPSTASLTLDPKREEFKLGYMSEGEKESFQGLLKYATTKDVCRRRYLTRYFDGTEMECSYIACCERCDVCESAAANTDENDTTTEVPDEFFDFDSDDEDPMQIDGAHAHYLISEERDLGLQLLSFLRIFEEKCIVCDVAKHIRVAHHISACPTMFGLCFRCFGRHAVKNCPKEIRTIIGTCPHCYLPHKIGDTAFHTKGFMVDCHGKDVLKFFALAALQFGAIEDSKREWLYSRDHKGMLNLWHAFVHHNQATE